MKDSILFLKEKLTELYSSHPYLEIRYEYKNIINSHIVEVKPIHCFNSDRQYILKQIEIENAFESEFYSEDIVFVTGDSLVTVKNPILNLGVSTINVDLSLTEFITTEYSQQKVSTVSTKSNIKYSSYMISGDNNFDVLIVPPETQNKSTNTKDSGVKLESFLF